MAPMAQVHRLDEQSRESVIATLARQMALRTDVLFAYVFGS